MCRGGNGCHEPEGLKVTRMPAWLIQKIYAEQYQAEVAEDHGQGTAERQGARLRGLRGTFSAVGGWGHMSHVSSDRAPDGETLEVGTLFRGCRRRLRRFGNGWLWVAKGEERKKH